MKSSKRRWISNLNFNNSPMLLKSKIKKIYSSMSLRMSFVMKTLRWSLVKMTSKTKLMIHLTYLNLTLKSSSKTSQSKNITHPANNIVGSRSSCRGNKKEFTKNRRPLTMKLVDRDYITLQPSLQTLGVEVKQTTTPSSKASTYQQMKSLKTMD